MMEPGIVDKLATVNESLSALTAGCPAAVWKEE